MKITAFSVAAAMAAVYEMGYAASQENQATFKSFHKVVSKYDYEWEVFPVHTEDGYELHIFRLLGPIHVDPIELEPIEEYIDEVIHEEE